MVSEPVAIDDDRFRLATVVKAIRDPEEYREIFEERSAAFEAAYPKLVARGIVALIVVPLVLFVLALVLDTKLPFIAGLAVALIVIYSYIIVVEYFHDRIVRKRALTNLSLEEREAVLTNTLRDELLPYASIDAIVERRRSRQSTGVIARMHQHVADRIESAMDVGANEDTPSGEDASGAEVSLGTDDVSGSNETTGSTKSSGADEATNTEVEASEGGDEQ
jgi:ABC-type multidrug transport system fused ATPase/permease subunit